MNEVHFALEFNQFYNLNSNQFYNYIPYYVQVKDENGKLAVWPLQGTTVDNNLVGFNYRDLVMDPDNMDFRPVKKSLADKNKVGPYERSARFYWIPGRQEEKTSSPVPPHGSTNVVAARRRHVMWLNAYKSSNHQVGRLVAVFIVLSRNALDDLVFPTFDYLGLTIYQSFREASN